MAKSKWRQEQEGKMETFSIRMTAAHARAARKLGKSGIAEGVRKAIELVALGGVDRRAGPKDRRRK